MTNKQNNRSHAKTKAHQRPATAGAHNRLGTAGAATDFFDGSGASAHHRESSRVAHGVPPPPASGKHSRPARIGCAVEADWECVAVTAIAKALRGLFCYRVDSGLRTGGGRWGQFRPYTAPSFLAQHLPGDDAARLRLNPAGFRWPHIAPARQALIQVLLVCIEPLRPIAPDFRGNFRLHGCKSSVTLPATQAFCTLLC